jgi:ADP-ribosylglycohydrolase
MNDRQRRARNTLLGLALGDAIGWPAMFHRSRVLPAWTRRLRREIDTQREEVRIIRVPTPFSLNQPAGAFDVCPTDDTEWAAWTMERLLASGCRVTPEETAASWKALASGTANVSGSVSTMVALENIRRGLIPPVSGHDNPHYFDDGAACRGVPIGIAFTGKPEEAARAAGIEASATNAEDGIWIASAIAAAASVACAGGRSREVVAAARAALPEKSWIARVVTGTLAAASGEKGLLSLLPVLHNVLNKEYSDGLAAPETLALTLAIVAHACDNLSDGVMAAASLAKSADSLPPLVGALCAALDEGDPVSPRWLEPLGTLRGVALPGMAGKNYHDLVARFVAACPSLTEGEPNR